MSNNDSRGQWIQSVLLDLADGRVVRYSGPAQIVEGDRVKGVRVVEPVPLPKGTTWEVLGGTDS